LTLVSMYDWMQVIAKDPVEAKQQSHTMEGVGITTEGIEQNPAVYELMAEMRWRHSPVTVCITLIRSLLTLIRSLLTLIRSLLTLIRSLLTLIRSLLTLIRSLIRSHLTLIRSLLTLTRLSHGSMTGPSAAWDQGHQRSGYHWRRLHGARSGTLSTAAPLRRWAR
jgi:hypothetical protein